MGDIDVVGQRDVLDLNAGLSARFLGATLYIPPLSESTMRSLSLNRHIPVQLDPRFRPAYSCVLGFQQTSLELPSDHGRSQSLLLHPMFTA